MTTADVISTTACIHGLRVAELRSKDRSRRIVRARAVAAFLAYELGGESYTELARAFGRDRSVICRIVGHVAERLSLRERRTTAEVARVEQALRGVDSRLGS